MNSNPGGIGFSGSNSSTDFSKTENQNINQNANGSYTNGPVNSGQILNGLDLAGSNYGAFQEQGTGTEVNGFGNINAGSTDAALASQAALPQLQKTLGGAYLNPSTNPALAGVIKDTIAAVRPGIDAGFEAGGRYGSPSAMRALGSGLGAATGAIQYGAYNDERGRQMTALGALPGYASSAIAPGVAQVSAGAGPLQQYLAALATLNPGTTGTTTSDLARRSVTDTSGTSDTTKFGAAASIGGGGAGGPSSGSFG